MNPVSIMMNSSLRAALGVVVLTALAACNRTPADVFTGYAEAELIYVSAPIAGVVEKVSVVRGATVKAGDELFVLDAEPESLARTEAAARLAQAQAQSANLSKARRPLEIEAAANQLKQAQAALAASQTAITRHRDLVARGFESASRLDELQASLNRDTARVKELEAQLALAKSPSRADEIAAAQAQVQASRAALAASQWREGQRRQTASVDATVFDVSYRAGERVAVNAPVIALLPQPGAAAGGLVLRFYVPQAQLAQVKLGQTVAVLCDGCAADLRATIAFVSPQAEYTPPVIYSNENRAKLVFMVQARPDEKTAAAVKPGQPVDIRLSPAAP